MATRPAAVRRAALALPEATEATHLHRFVGEAVREPTLAMQAACVEPLRWGSKVVGLR